MHHFFEKILHENPSEITPLSGGDINDVYEVTYSKGTHIFKINQASKFPEMLAKEASGLKLLNTSGAIKIPAVLDYGVLDDRQFLMLEKIHLVEATEKTWTQLGRQLAQLHQSTQGQFGLNYDNYIGSLIQQNNPADSWPEFLISRRLQPMLELAVNQGDVNFVEAKIFDKFYTRLNELLPDEKPALLHGDLWAGNFLTGSHEEPVLIDPAVYYGHREMDLAMMHLFGGFHATVFQSYHETYPLEKHWEERITLNQLYPLLVHVNLFGRTYWNRVQRIVEPFS